LRPLHCGLAVDVRRLARYRLGEDAADPRAGPRSQAREQRCWFHKIANVLGSLPKSAHPGAKKALAEIYPGRNPVMRFGA